MRGREGLAFLKNLNMLMAGEYRGHLNKALVKVDAGARLNVEASAMGSLAERQEIFRRGAKPSSATRCEL